MVNCSRCSRRTALAGIGALVVIGVAPGCAARSNLPTGSATPCAGGLCLDLTLDANAPLRSVGGAVLVHAAHDSIAVIRTSATALAALSAICTHEGCLMNHDASARSLDCPCHGSSFSDTSGAVLGGPAPRAVPTYGATLSGNTATLATV